MMLEVTHRIQLDCAHDNLPEHLNRMLRIWRGHVLDLQEIHLPRVLPKDCTKYPMK